MARPSLHLSPLADVLGAVILMTVPSFEPVVVQRIELQVAGCGVSDERHQPVEDWHDIRLKIGVSPTHITVRLDGVTLTKFRGTELWRLAAQLARVRQAFPRMTTVQLEIDDDVELGLLIAVADLCVGAGYPNVIAAPDAAEPFRSGME